MNFDVLKFITVRLMSLFDYDRRFHVRVDVAMKGKSLQRSMFLLCDNLFEISSAFERAKLQYFDACLRHSHL